jgi:hypothetical protein
MDPKPISEIIPRVEKDLQVTQGLKRLELLQSPQEKTYVAAIIAGKKISDCESDEVADALKYCFTLVGLRAKHIPNEFEALLLYEHIKSQYKNHTLEEFKFAFKLAVSGELEIKPEDVNPFDQFSIHYVTKIMAAYQVFAAEKHRKLEHYINPPDENQKLIEEIKNIHWGQLIEKEYQHFLLFGKERMKIWPAEFYQQMAEDNFFSQELYLEHVHQCRARIISELTAEKEKLSLRRFPMEGENFTSKSTSSRVNDSNTLDVTSKVQKFNYDPSDPKNFTIEKSKQIHREKISDTSKLIEEFNSGVRDDQIVLRAKQFCVLLVFRSAKSMRKKNLYQPAQ